MPTVRPVRTATPILAGSESSYRAVPQDRVAVPPAEAVLAVLPVALFAKQVFYRPAESSALHTHPPTAVLVALLVDLPSHQIFVHTHPSSDRTVVGAVVYSDTEADPSSPAVASAGASSAVVPSAVAGIVAEIADANH